MKTFNLFSLAALSMMAAAACNRTLPEPAFQPADITIQASIGQITKVQTTGYTSAFEAND